MSKRTGRHHNAELKAEASRRHHLKKEDVSAICGDRCLPPAAEHFYIEKPNMVAPSSYTSVVDRGASPSP